MRYTLENLVIKSLPHGPLGDVIGAAKVLASRIILKMRYRSSFKYLATKNAVRGTAESLKLGVRPETEDF